MPLVIRCRRRFTKPTPKAPAGWRTPRRFAFAFRSLLRVCVLGCGGPPPVLPRQVGRAVLGPPSWPIRKPSSLRGAQGTARPTRAPSRGMLALGCFFISVGGALPRRRYGQERR